MSIGPKDSLEQFIVKRYAQKQVNQPRLPESVIDPDKMMVSMNDYALAGKCMSVLGRKMTAVCYALNAANATYAKRKDLAHVLSVMLTVIISVSMI